MRSSVGFLGSLCGPRRFGAFSLSGAGSKGTGKEQGEAKGGVYFSGFRMDE